jgi:hypothetical protein
MLDLHQLASMSFARRACEICGFKLSMPPFIAETSARMDSLEYRESRRSESLGSTSVRLKAQEAQAV